MIKLHIKYRVDENGEINTLVVESSMHSITEEIFEKGKEDELESQKRFIADLIWGSIDSYTHRKIFRPSVTCEIEFENGHEKVVPQEIISYTI